MKLQLLLLFSLFLTAISKLMAAPPSCLQTKNGFVVDTGTSNALKIEVVSVNETRVIAVIQSPVKAYSKKSDLFGDVISFRESTSLKTKGLAGIDGWRLQRYAFKKIFRINNITPALLKSIGPDIEENKEIFYQEKKLVIKM